jgi:hypothetical protein
LLTRARAHESGPPPCWYISFCAAVRGHCVFLLFHVPCDPGARAGPPSSVLPVHLRPVPSGACMHSSSACGSSVRRCAVCPPPAVVVCWADLASLLPPPAASCLCPCPGRTRTASSRTRWSGLGTRCSPAPGCNRSRTRGCCARPSPACPPATTCAGTSARSSRACAPSTAGCLSARKAVGGPAFYAREAVGCLAFPP